MNTVTEIWNGSGPRAVMPIGRPPLDPNMNGGSSDQRGSVPPNDLCTGVVPQALTAGTTITFTGDNTGALNTEGLAYAQTWEEFTTTGCLDVTIDYCGTNFTSGIFYINVWGGCPITNFGTAFSNETTTCSDGNYTMTFPQLPADNYYIAVINNGVTGFGPYTIHASAVACSGAAPANDACAGAITLTPGATCVPVSGTVSHATASTVPNSCGGSANDEVWYKFVATTNTHTVQVTGAAQFDAVVELFSGACGALVSLGCADATLSGGTESITMGGLTIGTTYRVRVYDYFLGLPPTPTFTICVTTGANTPVNDLCSSVTAVPLAIGSPVTFTGDNTNATATNDAVAGTALNVGGDTTTVWHEFTTTECTNISVAYCGTAVRPAVLWAVLATSCPADSNLVFYTSGNFTACVDSNATILFNGVPAGTYYLPVRGEPVTAGPYTILVSATACIAPPPNDPCTGAIPLNVNLTCVPISGTDNGATQSLPAILCNGFTGSANDDVWYSFVATSPNNTVTMTGDAPFDGVMELFSGDCSALVSLACSDATLGGGVESIASTTLTPGATYYVRLYDYYGGYPTTTTFSICATGDVGTGVHDVTNSRFGVYPNPSNGDITITCHDVGGDALIEFFDMTGRIVHSERRALSAGGSITLPLNGQLAAGTYTLRLSNANGRSEQRVMIK